MKFFRLTGWVTSFASMITMSRYPIAFKFMQEEQVGNSGNTGKHYDICLASPITYDISILTRMYFISVT